MELREPPRPSPPPASDRVARRLLVVNLVLLVLLALGAALLHRTNPGSRSGSGDHRRQVAAKLKAAGVLDEAAELYEAYLYDADKPAESRGRIAYSLGTTHLDRGHYEELIDSELATADVKLFPERLTDGD